MAEPIPLDRTYESSHGAVRHGSVGAGDPVVMVHGTPWSSYVWRHAARALSVTHTVYVYDLPGYGRSEQFEGQDVSLGIQNDVLAELIEHWGVAAPAVVGHDFGGATVLRTHLLNEVPFARVALLDAVSLRPWGSPFYRHVREHRDAFAGMPDDIHRGVVEAYVRGAFHGDASRDRLEPYVRPWLGEVGRPAFYRQIAQNDPTYTDEVEDRYGGIEVPVLVLWGAEDEWLPVEIGERLHARIPGSTFETISGAGHLVQEDAPERVADRLAAFLDADG